ncbi:MAG: orotidine-5-phosphate decarboxylase [Actinomycetota bacterium]|nr:orotidine-5-phosphate decarboxylase [Actinomycetota bacterium]
MIEAGAGMTESGAGITESFGKRLIRVFGTSGHLCVGIDPHPYLLADWGLADSGEGLREFGLRVVDAAAGRAGIVKPQVAFFERHGSAGYAALEETIRAARAAGLLVIADAKRGDLGSSVEAYGQAWLTPGAPLEADAMTISAYQGVGSIAAPMELARQGGKGLFVLAATSNPEAFATQSAVIGSGVGSGDLAGRTVAASIVDEVNRGNEAGLASTVLDSTVLDSTMLDVAGLGSVGVVIGATVRLADFGITSSDLVSMPILGPGFGHQGADYESIRAIYGSAASNVVVSSSRAILDAGPADVAAAITAQARELAKVLG